MVPDSGPRAFGTMLEEYKIQRSAVSDKLKTSQHTITFGGATIGILIAAGFNIWDEPVPATLIFLVAVPLVSTAVVVQWFGQMRSFLRTHEYIKALETAMLVDLRREGDVPDALFSKHTPKSERWYRDEGLFQNAAVAVFVLLAGSSLVLGVYKDFADYKGLVLAIGAAEFIAVATVLILLIRSTRRGSGDTTPGDDGRQ
jgi:hypothetical protein